MPDLKLTDNPTPGPRAPRAPRKPRPAPKPASAPAPITSRPLIETEGPDPDAALKDVRLTIGTIAGTHGVDGELKLRLATDDPDQLKRLKRVYIGDETAPRRLLGVRFHQGIALVRISGVATAEQGRELFRQSVRIAGSDARPLKPGEFYYYQVIGISAFDESGARIGTVADILETGANDVFVIRPEGDGPEMLLPNIPDVILEIDTAGKRMVIRPLVYWDSK
jgi:16S rRNA processing protein RimM